jgi:hypothetical protein
VWQFSVLHYVLEGLLPPGELLALVVAKGHTWALATSNFHSQPINTLHFQLFTTWSSLQLQAVKKKSRQVGFRSPRAPASSPKSHLGAYPTKPYTIFFFPTVSTISKFGSFFGRPHYLVTSVPCPHSEPWNLQCRARSLGSMLHQNLQLGARLASVASETFHLPLHTLSAV